MEWLIPYRVDGDPEMPDGLCQQGRHRSESNQGSDRLVHTRVVLLHAQSGQPVNLSALFRLMRLVRGLFVR